MVAEARQRLQRLRSLRGQFRPPGAAVKGGFFVWFGLVFVGRLREEKLVGLVMFAYSMVLWAKSGSRVRAGQFLWNETCHWIKGLAETWLSCFRLRLSFTSVLCLGLCICFLPSFCFMKAAHQSPV